MGSPKPSVAFSSEPEEMSTKKKVKREVSVEDGDTGKECDSSPSLPSSSKVEHKKKRKGNKGATSEDGVNIYSTGSGMRRNESELSESFLSPSLIPFEKSEKIHKK